MNNALANKFENFVGSLYADKALPPVAVVQECDDARSYYKRTGMVPVLAEDESADCPVFENWGTHYEFEAWRAYRQMTTTGKAFQAMVTDVLDRQQWSPEVAKWITLIDGLVNVTQEYSDKFGHEPAHKAKLVKSYERYGRDTALVEDRY